MAEVLLAEKVGAEGFARTVAIKTVITHGAEEEAVNLFLDEARVASFLNHAAIVQTLDLGFENDTLFIVMEYIPGPALSRVLKDLKKEGRFLPPEIVAYTGARVAAALDYAHRRATTPDGTRLALVHRDISPQNVMLTRSGLVKLTDFGVARASTQTHKTRTGQVRGKAAYMAPEQVRAKALDGRTDVFALGLVLYEALTNTRAYQRKTDINSMRAILTDPVAPIESINPNVPAELSAVVMRALQKDPEARFQTAGEMEAALTASHRHQAPSAIERQITDLLDELFGPVERYSQDDGMPVEAWQPTMAVAGDAATPKRLPGSGLSPRIKEMLATPPSTPSQEQVDSAALLSPVGLGTSASVAAATAPVADPRSPGSGSLPFAEPPPTASVSHVTSPTRARTSSPLAKVGLPILLLLIGAIGGVGYSVLTNEEPISPAPSRPERAVTPRPEPTVDVVAKSEPKPKAQPKRENEPKQPAKRHPQPVRKRPVKNRPVKKPAAEAPLKRPSRREAQPKEAIAALKKRVFTAWQKHKAMNTEHAKTLQRILLDLEQNKAPTPKMRKALRAAEAALE